MTSLFRPGTSRLRRKRKLLWLREVRRLQKSTDLLFRKQPFGRVVSSGDLHSAPGLPFLFFCFLLMWLKVTPNPLGCCTSSVSPEAGFSSLPLSVVEPSHPVSLPSPENAFPPLHP